MYIITAKLNKRKIASAAVVLAAAVLAVVFLFPGKEAAQTAAVKGSTDEQRSEYLDSLGYETVLSEQKQTVLPEKFEGAFERYNDMQKECGFDLEPYRGKKVTVYTYSVLNYGDGSENVLCDVIVYKRAIIGGAIYSVGSNGFMHGLRAQ